MISSSTGASCDVALLAEGVDRNFFKTREVWNSGVALLAEGVDRNILDDTGNAALVEVALLAEGVDRNLHCTPSTA